MNNENNELLKAALALIDELRRYPNSVLAGNANGLIQTIEKHRPKPKLVEGWAADYGYTYPTAMHCGETLERVEKLCPNAKRYIRVREVTDPPKWEKWAAYEGMGEIATASERVRSFNLSRICELHNAELERFEKAWKGGE